MQSRVLRSLISIGALVVAGVHVVWPGLAIDGVTALLLLVSIVPWLQPLFKSVELPGGVKVEFQDFKEAEARADAAGLLANAEPSTSRAYTFQSVASEDPSLALAGLRIELERKLDALARSRGYEGNPRGIGNLLKHLRSHELISAAESASLKEIVDLLNEAVHGARVDEDAAYWALDIGPRILRVLAARTSGDGIASDGAAGLPQDAPT